jgi:hypothetical protein
MPQQGDRQEERQGKCTRTLIVLNEGGKQADSQCHSGWGLWEVVEGPFRGQRGCMNCLLELLGAAQFDQTQAISYETGEKIEGIPLPDPTFGGLLSVEDQEEMQRQMDEGSLLDAMEDGELWAVEQW